MKDSYTVQLVSDENCDVVLPPPDELMKKMRWQVGDVLDFKLQGRDQLHVVNYSIQSLYASKLHRDFNSIIRRLNSPTDPLNRVIIIRRYGRSVIERALLILPADYQDLDGIENDYSRR